MMNSYLKIALIGLLLVVFARRGGERHDKLWKNALEVIVSTASFTAAVYLFIKWIVPMLIGITG